jgi:hypothetical protein
VARTLRPRPGGSRRLVYLISRYGGAIEADLAAQGWDLAALWQQRRWRFLLNLIDRLPRVSHFVTATADDEELAEQLPEPEEGSSAPPLTEWTPEVERLTLIADRLAEVVTAVGNTVAKKPRKAPRPLPRPMTARDRIRKRKRRERHHLILKRLQEAKAAGRPSMDRPLASTDTLHAAARPRSRRNGRK